MPAPGMEKEIRDLIAAQQAQRAFGWALIAFMGILMIVIMAGWTSYRDDVESLRRFRDDQLSLNDAQAEFNIEISKRRN